MSATNNRSERKSGASSKRGREANARGPPRPNKSTAETESPLKQETGRAKLSGASSHNEDPVPISPGSSVSRSSPPSAPSSGRPMEHGKHGSSSSRSPPKSEKHDEKPRPSSNGSPRSTKSTGSNDLRNGKVDLFKPSSELEPISSKIQNAGNASNMIVACHLKQSMGSDVSLVCYRFAIRKPGPWDERNEIDNDYRTAAVTGFLEARFTEAKSYIFTDYQRYLISTSKLSVATLQDSENIGAQDAIVGLRYLATVQWSNVLEFLNSATMPKPRDDITPAPNEAVESILRVLLTNAYASKDCNRTSKKLPPLLDVQSHGQPAKSTPQPLADMMRKDFPPASSSLRELETYLKGHAVKIHPAPGGLERTKRIIGLARPNDGDGTKASLGPKVKAYGGNSLQVQFYYKYKQQSSNGATTSSGPSPSRYITVAEYFGKIKNQELKYPELPVINVGTRRKPTYIPPEVCSLLDAQKATSSEFNHTALEDIAQLTDTDGFLKTWSTKLEFRHPGLKMPPKLAKSAYSLAVMAGSVIAPCQLLQGPPIAYRDGNTISTISGAWGKQVPNFQKEKALKVAVLRIGSLPAPAEKEVAKSEKELLDDLNTMGLSVTQGDTLKVDSSYQKFNKAIRETIRTSLEKLAKSEPDAVFVVLPKDRPVYDYVKRQCEIDLGIQNVCANAPTVVNAKQRYCRQLGLKLNLKAGRQNQVLKGAGAKNIHFDSTMIVGLDTILPPPKAHEGARGITAIVNSMDETLTRWPASVELLGNRAIHEQTASLLKKRLDFWKKTRSSYPENVIVYHNGLTAKDRTLYADQVSGLIQEAFVGERAQKRRPNLTIIVVDKDHHAQLRSLRSSTDPEGKKYIPDATVLLQTKGADKDNTWEFVMQGHRPQKSVENVNGGSPLQTKLEHKNALVPVRYSVLKNEIFKTREAREELELLTHNMRYLSGCNTSVVADTLPIHYVGLLCKRIQSYVRPWYHPDEKGCAPQGVMTQESVQPKEEIKDSMFYI